MSEPRLTAVELEMLRRLYLGDGEILIAHGQEKATLNRLTTKGYATWYCRQWFLSNKGKELVESLKMDTGG